MSGWHNHGTGWHTHSRKLRLPDGPTERFHVHGVVLPDETATDLWIIDGHISYTPVADAHTIARNVWILPGLVDAHCHIGLDDGGAVSKEKAEHQAVTERDAGVLLIRDAGSPSDTRWIDDRDDLPTIIRAGRHVARPKRYIRNYAAEVEPPDLVATVEAQAKAGDGWVKLVGDWIDRETGDLGPLWDFETARAAIERAHELGARVTAHCFAEDAPAMLVAAGIDGIEHGTGLDDATIDLMAERQVALVPTMVNLENFESIAASGEAKFPTYAAHMRHLYRRRIETLGKAYEAGVPIYAGTDAGGVVPHGLIGQEVELLRDICGNADAVAAASWRARTWLGHENLVEGASADLVIVESDPRVEARTLSTPLAVFLAGRLIARG